MRAAILLRRDAGPCRDSGADRLRPRTAHAARGAERRRSGPLPGGGHRRHRQACDGPHAQAFLRHASFGERHRYPHHPGAARPQQSVEHGALHQGLERSDPAHDEPARPVEHRGGAAGLTGSAHVGETGGGGYAHHGTHLFRHSLATDLLRSGASFDEIGQLLRHETTDSTRIYAKLDIEKLRTLSQPWPGGVQ